MEEGLFHLQGLSAPQMRDWQEQIRSGDIKDVNLKSVLNLLKKSRGDKFKPEDLIKILGKGIEGAEQYLDIGMGLSGAKIDKDLNTVKEQQKKIEQAPKVFAPGSKGFQNLLDLQKEQKEKIGSILDQAVLPGVNPEAYRQMLVDKIVDVTGMHRSQAGSIVTERLAGADASKIAPMRAKAREFIGELSLKAAIQTSKSPTLDQYKKYLEAGGEVLPGTESFVEKSGGRTTIKSGVTDRSFQEGLKDKGIDMYSMLESLKAKFDIKDSGVQQVVITEMSDSLKNGLVAAFVAGFKGGKAPKPDRKEGTSPKSLNSGT
jgi:hypothetical protein